MPVTEWFIIKSLTIPSSWVAVLLALFVTGIVLRLKYGKTTEDWFSDSAILFVLVWKFSVLLTDFNMIVDYPLAVLYFNGGETGLFLGVIAALGRLLWQLRKNGWNQREFIAIVTAFVLLQSIYQFLMVSMNDAELWQKVLTVVIFLGMLFLTWRNASRSDVWRFQLLILLLFTHILVALMQPEGVLQTPLMITGLFVICGLTVYALLNKQQLEENK